MTMPSERNTPTICTDAEPGRSDSAAAPGGPAAMRRAQPLSTLSPVPFLVPKPLHARPVAVWLPLGAALVVAVISALAPEWSRRVLFAEGWGPIEFMHVVLPAALAGVGLGLLTGEWHRMTRALRGFVLALIAGGVFIAGEEASWGQHAFGWETPPDWAALNRQGETNLHNATSWLNHKPRVALNILVLAGCIAIPLLRRWRPRVGAPALALPDPSTWLLGWLVGGYMLWDAGCKAGLLPSIAARESEMHELFLYGFLLAYALALRERLRSATDIISRTT